MKTDDHLLAPINDEKRKEIDEQVSKQYRHLSIDENVEKDTFKINGQNYALVSFVSPESNQKIKEGIGMKIKGVFDKLDEAKEHAEKLQKLDPTFDIYVVEMYSWLLVPPNPDLVSDQVNVDQKLNDIIVGHKESQLKSKMYFEERKRELQENIKKENTKQIEENEKIKEINVKQESEENEENEENEEKESKEIN